MAEIDKKLLTHLAGLARLELSEAETDKFLHDLVAIVDHVKELEGVKTDGVVPMTGGTELKNLLRDDNLHAPQDTQGLRSAFPDASGDFLKVPNVFE